MRSTTSTSCQTTLRQLTFAQLRGARKSQHDWSRTVLLSTGRAIITASTRWAIRTIEVGTMAVRALLRQHPGLAGANRMVPMLAEHPANQVPHPIRARDRADAENLDGAAAAPPDDQDFALALAEATASLTTMLRPRLRSRLRTRTALSRTTAQHYRVASQTPRPNGRPRFLFWVLAACCRCGGSQCRRCGQ